LLAENPLTEFDFIGHSNGTYIFGYSLLSTPCMRFNNAVLAAPVLPTDFDWNKLLERKQVAKVRYDTANGDWAVGILCPLLNAVGFSDVGPSGVVLFGDGTMIGSEFIKKVGWYKGNHGAALRVDPSQKIDNRLHLLNFALEGVDETAGEPLAHELGRMQTYSRLTKYVTWLVLASLLVLLAYNAWWGQGISLLGLLAAAALLTVLYVALDVY
jgi:hypothetical protein